MSSRGSPKRPGHRRRPPTHVGGDDTRRAENRGQATTVAFALLVLLTVGGVTTVVVFGSTALGSLESEASTKQAEHAFTKLDSVGAEVALGESQARTVELGLGPEGGERLQTVQTGTMTLRYQNGTTIHSETLGAVVYEKGDRTLAYQGGGVWRGSGDASRMVSPPEVHYDQGTLTLPLVAVRGSDSVSSDGVTVRKQSSSLGLGPGIVENEIIVLEVQSDYYTGWAQFFEKRIDDSQVSVDHGTRTVSVELGRIDFGVVYESAIYAEDGDVGVTNGNAVIDGPVVAEGEVTDASVTGDVTENARSSYDPLDPLIDQRMADAPTDSSVTTTQISDGDSFSGGETIYDPDGVTLSNNDEVTVDLSGGNVTLLVDGDVTVDNSEIRVENPGDNRLKIFTTGDVTVDNGKVHVAGSDVDAENLLVFGRSDTQFGMGGGNKAYFEGAVYAPRNEQVSGVNTAYPGPNNKCELDGYYADTCLATGSSGFDGAVVAGPTALQQNAELTFDPDLESLQMTVTADEVLAPELSYLHISVNEIEVDDS